MHVYSMLCTCSKTNGTESMQAARTALDGRLAPLPFTDHIDRALAGCGMRL